jgi:phytoene/squalene synthetase
MNVIKQESGPSLAATITKAASRQTYYTVRLLADRQLVDDAYRVYAYFRWVDDALDSTGSSPSENLAFIDRQKSLLAACYRQAYPLAVNANEQMLVDLVRHDPAQDSGLRVYLYNMMAVMDFDARRRGRLVSQKELDVYTHHLASAVTEAMHYFIGHCCPTPSDETRYLAVTAAHITHMLRDTYDDVQHGYYNIPGELLAANHLQPDDLHSSAYRLWVRSRVQLARGYFALGKRYLARVRNLRCRLAGYAYTARFEWLLDTFQREDYCLRPAYSERKSFRASLGMSGLVLSSLLNLPGSDRSSRDSFLSRDSFSSRDGFSSNDGFSSPTVASQPVASRKP